MDFVFPLIVLFMVIVLPLFIIMHYITKWKSIKGLSAEEQRMLEELWRDSQGMESRLNALETILDDELPNWRKRL